MKIKRTTGVLLLAFCALQTGFGQVRIAQRTTPSTTPAAPADSSDRERQGPVNKPVSLFEQIEGDYDFKNDYFDVVNIDGLVYEDANPKSGYYYYFPKEYQLSWGPITGYDFSLNYLSSGASGAGKVVLTLKLQPNISKEDIKLAEQLVKNAIRNKPGKTFSTLQSIPLGESSKISFKRLEGILDAGDVNITVPSNFLDPIVLILKTDRPDDLLTLLFTDIGLRGDLTIFPAGDVPSQVVPITIKLDYHKTFGTAELTPGTWRSEGWVNNAPFPVILKNLHVLRMENRAGIPTPAIYTWEMGNKELTEGGKAKFDASQVPVWLDGDKTVKKMWLEYMVKPCRDCNTEVRNNLLNATSRSEVSLITFDVLDVLETSGASKMRLRVRSVQLDPNGKQKVEKNPPYTITQDGATLESFQLFVPQGQTPQFEYAVSLVMPDGDIKQSAWVSNKSKTEIGIGRNFLKEYFPDLKKPVSKD
jgi:hypothetical protein